MKLILAPMAAISHSGLRRLIAEFGEPDEYFSEMIHAPSAISGGGFEKWYFRCNPSPEKLVWQVTSPEAESAAKAVPILLKNGGFGIDLNMGCCAPQIVNTGAGFAWVQKPYSETAEFVRKVKEAVLKWENGGMPLNDSHSVKEKSALEGFKSSRIRLSVKLRLGETEDYAALLKFCKMLVSEGAELITLHPRTRRQKYSRPCKHQYTARLAEDLSIPVYANGDIDSLNKFSEYSSIYKCSGWMIGRAAVQKPWIFSEIKETLISGAENNMRESGIDLFKTACRFLQLLKEEQPEEFYLTRAQRFFAYFCDNFKFAHHIKSKILNCKNLESMRQKLEEYFQEVPEDIIYNCRLPF